jgi:phage tail sheath protein FI
MPATLSYPGVYIEELPSGVRTITGVATSIGAFVDFFSQGPMNEATQVLSFADFERTFGGLDVRSEGSYAVQQFFLNGGSNAYIVRTSSTTAANAAAAAAIAMEDGPGGAVVLTATAKSAGAWGNGVRIDVDYGAKDPATMFNLTITEVAMQDGKVQVLATENFRNLVIDPTSATDAAKVVNAGSRLITLTEAASSSGKRPAQTGSISKVNPDPASIAVGDTVDVSLGATKLGTTKGLPAVQTTLSGAASALQALLRGLDKNPLPNATVSVVGNSATSAWLVVRAGTGAAIDSLLLGGTGLAAKLGFAAGGQNVQQYALGGDAAQAQGLPGASKVTGSDGTWNGSADAAGVAGGLIGDENAKTGMWALKDVDLFNILCIPGTVGLDDVSASAVASQATLLCQERRAMYLLDPPQVAGNRDTVDGVKSWLEANSTLRNRNVATYFPRVDIADPLNAFRLRPTAASGTVAGLYARTDTARGVWKAPAGTEATLAGVQKLEYKLTDGENGLLNPLAINCLRVFPVYGPVCWGARTLMGADQLGDEYKYVPIRRLALFLEESLFRGTQWIVFEPNDEPLWSQIRLNLGAFMHNLFRQGAFQGQTPQDAYFVKCDKDTTTQNDIDLGIVNIVVGFAPLKPAEFVVLKIQQIAGQIVS